MYFTLEFTKNLYIWNSAVRLNHVSRAKAGHSHSRTLTDDDRYAGCLAIDCFSFRESSTSHTLSSPAVRRHSLTLLVKKTLPFFSPHTCSSRVAVSISHTLLDTVFPSLFLRERVESVLSICFELHRKQQQQHLSRNHSHKYSQTRDQFSSPLSVHPRNSLILAN